MRKGITVILVGILLSLVMPFSIYAETLQSHVEGINVWTDRIDYLDISTSQQSNIYRNYCNVNVEIVFDAQYVGYQNLGVSVKYWNYSTSNSTWSQTTSSVSGNYYINGNKLNIVIPITFISNSNPYYQAGNGTGQVLPNSSSQVTLSLTNTGNIIEYSELQTLNDILTVLNDVYSSIDDIENKMDLENDILNKIYNTKQWHIPIESFTAVYQLLNYKDSIYTNTVNYFDYPVFQLKTDDKLFVLWTNLNEDNYYIFGTDYNIYDNTSLNNLLKTSDANVTLTYDYSYQLSVGTDYFRIIRIKIRKNSGSGGNTTVSMKIDGYPSGTKIMPIYLAKSSNQNISTDFALIWNLDNRLLNYLKTIANGTTQSNSAASGLEQNNNQMATDMNSLATIESGYNQDFNSQMQNIDFSNPITNNQGLLPAANFVINVFNGLINNNPLSVLIIVCCILLIGKRVIGK